MTEIRIDEIQISLQGTAQDARRLGADLRAALGTALQEQQVGLAQARTGLVPEVHSSAMGGTTTADALARRITETILKAAQ